MSFGDEIKRFAATKRHNQAFESSSVSPHDLARFTYERENLRTVGERVPFASLETTEKEFRLQMAQEILNWLKRTNG